MNWFRKKQPKPDPEPFVSAIQALEWMGGNPFQSIPNPAPPPPSYEARELTAEEQTAFDTVFRPSVPDVDNAEALRMFLFNTRPRDLRYKNLPAFNLNAMCPKCKNAIIASKLIPAAPDRALPHKKLRINDVLGDILNYGGFFPGHPEHLERSCQCGYSWLEACADAK